MVSVWLRGMYRKNHWYIQVYLKMIKNWIERREYIGKKVKGSFIAKGKTVGITEKGRKMTLTGRQNRERGQIPD